MPDKSVYCNPGRGAMGSGLSLSYLLQSKNGDRQSIIRVHNRLFGDKTTYSSTLLSCPLILPQDMGNRSQTPGTGQSVNGKMPSGQYSERRTRTRTRGYEARLYLSRFYRAGNENIQKRSGTSGSDTINACGGHHNIASDRIPISHSSKPFHARFLCGLLQIFVERSQRHT
jgi:hypothetical protein